MLFKMGVDSPGTLLSAITPTILDALDIFYGRRPKTSIQELAETVTVVLSVCMSVCVCVAYALMS